jgi:TolA-binding protein
MGHLRRSAAHPNGGRLRFVRAAARLQAWATFFACVLLGLGIASCDSGLQVDQLSNKAKSLWEQGQYEEAARTFVAVTEVAPNSGLTEESYFWAGCLYQYYLNNPAQATRYYQLIALRYPDGEYYNRARKNLAEVFEQDPNTMYRALQIYRQLLRAKELRAEQEKFQFKIALLNLQMGRTDQARYELRTFLRNYPSSRDVPQAYYLVGFSYYLDKRPRVALAVMQQAVKNFPGSAVAAQAQFFMADTQEEQGNLQDALRLFQGLTGTAANAKIVEKRIQTLEARIRRGVR